MRSEITESTDSVDQDSNDAWAMIDRKPNRSKPLSGILASIALVLSSGLSATVHETPETPDTPQPASESSQATPRSLDELIRNPTEKKQLFNNVNEIILHPVRIAPDEESAAKPPKGLAYGDILETVDSVRAQLYATMQGTMGLDVPTNREDFPTIIVAPEGVDKITGNPCYPHDQANDIVRQAHSDIVPEKSSPSTADISVGLLYEPLCVDLVNDSSCKIVHAYAHDSRWMVFSVDKDDKGGYETRFTYDLAKNGDEESTNLSGIVLHELGHNLGLPHVERIECGYTNWRDAAFQDVADIIGGDNGCDLARNDDGEPDNYAGQLSAMGHAIPSPLINDERIPMPVYSSLERNIIQPNNFPVEKISLEGIAGVPGGRASYDLGYGVGKLNGIKIDLPDNHPLRTNPEYNANQLYVTLEPSWTGAIHPNESINCENNSFCNVYISARGDGMNFELPNPSAGDIIDIVQEGDTTIQRQAIYVDESLGIVILKITSSRWEGRTNVRQDKIEIVDLQTVGLLLVAMQEANSTTLICVDDDRCMPPSEFQRGLDNNYSLGA